MRAKLTAALGALALLAALESPATGATAGSSTLRLLAGAQDPYFPPQLAGATWTRLPTSEREVALTFDAGANAAGVGSILSTLAREGVPGTFFLTGNWVNQFPSSARQIAAQPGNAFGNHTFDHPHLPAITSDDAVRAEVTQAGAAIEAVTGRDPHPLFRFPYGDYDARTLGIVNSLDYGSIFWTVDTLGWQGVTNQGNPTGQSVSTVVSRSLNAATPGEIVLMHVGSAPDGTTLDADALPQVIAGLRARGYRFVSLWDAVREFRVDTFVRGTDGGVGHRWWNGVQWQPWESLGGGQIAPDSAPAAVSWGFNRLDVFVRRTDDQLWHAWWNGIGWSAWEPLGGVLTSAPAVASWSFNRLDVFVRGSDGQMYRKWWDGAGWSGWEPLGGILTSAPGAVSWSPNRIDVFVAGIDGQMYHRWWDGAGWKGWEPLGGVLSATPAAASWSANRVDVFVRGSDRQMHHRWWDGVRWNGWESHGGVLTSGPGAVSRRFNSVDVFVNGTDSQMWHRWWDGTSWKGWEPLGGVLTSGPGAAK